MFCTYSALLLLFIAYGVAALPFTYLLSFLFSSTTKAYVVFVTLNVTTGVYALRYKVANSSLPSQHPIIA